jgi:hypothetical protein
VDGNPPCGGTTRRSAGWPGSGFPDGSRRKVERIDQVEAGQDLDELLRLRDEAKLPGVRRVRLLSFDEAIDDWLGASCPDSMPSKRSRHAKAKSENTLDKIRSLLDSHMRPRIGRLRVDRTSTERVELVFQEMDQAGYATSTIDHTWSYLNRLACTPRATTGSSATQSSRRSYP